MARGKKSKPSIVKADDLDVEMEFADPREEFVYTRQPIEMVAMKWDGKQGYREANILDRCEKERWNDQKANFIRLLNAERSAAFARKMSDFESNELMTAVKRHTAIGNTLQMAFFSKIRNITNNAGKQEKIFVDNNVPVPMSAGDIIRMGKDGVAIERKALGVADEIVKIQFAEGCVSALFSFMTKYIVDSEIIRLIGSDFEDYLEKQYKMLERAKLSAGDSR